MMLIETLFCRQTGTIIVYILSLFAVYRVLIKAQDATAVLFIAVTLFYSGAVIADEHPIGFVVPYDWADYTEEQKKLYVSGVLDGQIFLLYGAKSPELESFLKCVKKEGVETIVNHTDIGLALGEDIKYPMPWAISKGVGVACKEYRKK